MSPKNRVFTLTPNIRSSDPDEDFLTYEWAFITTPFGSQATLTDDDTERPYFSPDLPGQYTAELVVNDGFDDSAPDEVVISVITANQCAEGYLVDALNIVTGLPLSMVTTKGNRTALGNFIAQAIEALQSGDTDKAIDKIVKSMDRTDGCVDWIGPDGNGPGRDWITTCVEQQSVYDLLAAALDCLN